MNPDPTTLISASLFAYGESLSNEHPERVQRALIDMTAIERSGIHSYARAQGITLETGVERLFDGLALRYFTALAT